MGKRPRCPVITTHSKVIRHRLGLSRSTKLCKPGWLGVSEKKRTRIPRVPRVGGVGRHVPPTEPSHEIQLSAPLHEDERQTNNGVELAAAITTLRLFYAMSVRACVVTS